MKTTDNSLGNHAEEVFEYYKTYRHRANSNFKMAKSSLSDLIWKYSKKIDTGFISVEAKLHVQMGLIKKPVCEHFIPISLLSEFLLTSDLVDIETFKTLVTKCSSIRKVSRDENYKLKKFYEDIDLKTAELNYEKFYAEAGVVQCLT
jgi:hypothetical protein